MGASVAACRGLDGTSHDHRLAVPARFVGTAGPPGLSPGSRPVRRPHACGPGAPGAALRPRAVWLVAPRVGPRLCARGRRRRCVRGPPFLPPGLGTAPRGPLRGKPSVLGETEAASSGDRVLSERARRSSVFFEKGGERGGTGGSEGPPSPSRRLCAPPRAFALAPGSRRRVSGLRVCWCFPRAGRRFDFGGPPPVCALPTSSTRQVLSLLVLTSGRPGSPSPSVLRAGAGGVRSGAWRPPRPPHPSPCVFFHVFPAGNAFWFF